MSGMWRQEWRLFIKAPASIGILSLFFCLCVVGAWNGAARVFTERARAAVAVQQDLESFANKRAKLVDLENGTIQEGQFGSPRKAHQAVLSAARPLIPPPAELPVLSSAQQPTPALLPVSILTRHKDQLPDLDDPSNRLDGQFDIAFIATWLAPLFALLLVFDVLARDREQGIAALLTSQGHKLGNIAFTRLAIRFSALFAVMAGVTIVAVLVTEAKNLGIALPALALWLAAFGLALGFWMALAAIVNGRARGGAAAALALFSMWIVMAVLLPALAGSIVNATAPPPSRMLSILDLRTIETDLTSRRDEVTKAYYEAHPENAPISEGDEYEKYFVTEMYPRTLAFDKAFAPITAAADEAHLRHARAMRMAAVFSPPLAFKLLTEDLAGGAPERRVAFLTSVDDFQARWRQFFDHKLASMRPLCLADYDQKPEFESRSEPVRQRWSRLVLLICAIAALFSGAFVLGQRALRHAQP